MSLPGRPTQSQASASLLDPRLGGQARRARSAAAKRPQADGHECCALVRGGYGWDPPPSSEMTSLSELRASAACSILLGGNRRAWPAVGRRLTVP